MACTEQWSGQFREPSHLRRAHSSAYGPIRQRAKLGGNVQYRHHCVGFVCRLSPIAKQISQLSARLRPAIGADPRPIRVRSRGVHTDRRDELSTVSSCVQSREGHDPVDAPSDSFVVGKRLLPPRTLPRRPLEASLHGPTGHRVITLEQSSLAVKATHHGNLKLSRRPSRTPPNTPNVGGGSNIRRVTPSNASPSGGSLTIIRSRLPPPSRIGTTSLLASNSIHSVQSGSLLSRIFRLCTLQRPKRKSNPPTAFVVIIKVSCMPTTTSPRASGRHRLNWGARPEEAVARNGLNISTTRRIRN
jgi:hypothetical protein